MSAYRLSFRRALTFANASPRYAINPVTGAVTGPYAAGIPAIVTVGGERYLQVERAVQNSALYSNNFTQYTNNTGLTISGDQNQVGPIGGAASLLLETTDNSAHRLYTAYAHTGTYTWSLCVKKYGSANRWVRMPGTAYINRYNLQTNVWDTIGADNTNHFTISLGNGWYRIGFTVTSEGSSYSSVGLSDSAINDNYTGSTSVGLYVWQRTIQPVSYATSITTTVASAVTRAKDEGYIPAASVPTALKDKGTQSFRPAWSSDQVTTGDLRYLCEFADTTQNIKSYYNGTDKKIYVYGASALVASDATTHSANQKLTVAYDRSAGSITLSGFTTGNGTYTGTAWNRTDGNLYVGMDASLANQIDGCISELGILS